MLRAVLDTNVVLAARKARTASSPNAEIISRWEAGEFTWLVTDGILKEYLEKLLELGYPPDKAKRFLTLVACLADLVQVSFYHTRHYPVDSEDTIFLLAALNGNAPHVVTYDEHLESVGVFYPEFRTCRPVEFLGDLRAQATA
jgi:predicted nucleic acid-binding protein